MLDFRYLESALPFMDRTRHQKYLSYFLSNNKTAANQ